MNARQQLLDALLVERFGTPTPEYQPTGRELAAAEDRVALIEAQHRLRVVEEAS